MEAGRENETMFSTSQCYQKCLTILIIRPDVSLQTGRGSLNCGIANTMFSIVHGILLIVILSTTQHLSLVWASRQGLSAGGPSQNIVSVHLLAAPEHCLKDFWLAIQNIDKGPGELLGLSCFVQLYRISCVGGLFSEPFWLLLENLLFMFWRTFWRTFFIFSIMFWNVPASTTNVPDTAPTALNPSTTTLSARFTKGMLFQRHMAWSGAVWSCQGAL